MHDKFADLFLQACATNGRSIVGEEEWTKFFHSIIGGGLVNTSAEAKQVEEIWLERVTAARAFSSSSTKPTLPELEFSDFQSRILSSHPVANSNEAALVASSIKQKALNLASLLNDQNPNSFDEDKTRQLLSVMYELEKEHIKMLDKTENLTENISNRLELTSLKALTTSASESPQIGEDVEGGLASVSREADTSSSFNDLPNPIIFFNQNLAMIEKSSLKHKVRSIRFSGKTSDSRGKVAQDTYNFGQNFTDINNIHVYKCQGTNKGKLIELIALVCPTTKVPPAALSSLWDSYSAHKGLSLASTCVPHAMGVEEDNGDLLFYFEHIPARSLSSMMYDKRVSSGVSGYVLEEESILFKHWARETLIALSQLQEQSAHVLLNAHDVGPENVMLSRQGTSVRLGRLLWGPHFLPETSKIGVKQFFRQRECALLRGFGRILRSVLSADADKEAVKKFVPKPKIFCNVQTLLEQEERENEFRENNDGDHIVFPVSLTVGQRLVVKLPPVNSVRRLQQDSEGKLGENVRWHSGICSNIFQGGNNGTGGGNSTAPFITPLPNEGSALITHIGENKRPKFETVTVDANGNATLVFLASAAGFCEVQIPFFDPDLKSAPENATITIAAEIIDVPSSTTLKAIMTACIEAENETKNFTTLRSLLEHKYFEPLGVGDLADVMSIYETEFAEGDKTKGRKHSQEMTTVL